MYLDNSKSLGEELEEGFTRKAKESGLSDDEMRSAFNQNVSDEQYQPEWGFVYMGGRRADVPVDDVDRGTLERCRAVREGCWAGAKVVDRGLQGRRRRLPPQLSVRSYTTPTRQWNGASNADCSRCDSCGGRQSRSGEQDQAQRRSAICRQGRAARGAVVEVSVVLCAQGIGQGLISHCRPWAPNDGL